MAIPDPAALSQRSRSVSELLTVLVLAITLPLIACSALVLWRYTEQQQQAARASALAAANDLANDIEREIHGLVATLSGLATSPALQTGDIGAFDAQARRVADILKRPILLWDAKTGFQLVNTRLAPGEELPRLALPSNAQAVVKTRAPYVSDLMIGQVTAKPLVFVGVPVFKGGDVAFIVVASIDPEPLAALLASRPGGEHWTTAVLDRTGAVIARSGGGEEPSGQKSALAAPGQSISGVERIVDSDGQSVIHGYRRLAFGWTAVALTPVDYVEGPLRESWLLFLAVGAGLIGVALPLALSQARLITGAISLAASNALALERGEVVPIRATAVAEADDVTRSLHAASHTLRERTRSLAESAARFRSAFDQAAVGFVQQDLEGRWVDVNGRFCELLGLTRAECLTVTPSEVVHPDDRHIEALRRESILRGEAKSASYEMRYIAKDCATVWVRATTSLVHHADGYAMYFITIVEDVTAERLTDIDRSKLAALVEASGDPMISLAMANIVETCNPATSILLGKERSDLIGQPFDRLFATAAFAKLAPVLERAWSGQAGRTETRVSHRDGPAIDVSVNVSPIRTHNGLVSGLAVTMEDIRERRRWESQLLLLNRELQHRVKNSLAVVQSIANQTLHSSETMEDFKPAFEGRLHALAGANDLLLQTKWTGEHLSSIVARQVEPLLNVLARQLDTSGEDVMVPAGLVVPLSLALHELATNALKHGSLKSVQGHVAIMWRVAQVDDQRELVLTWTESGGPPPCEPHRRGFGSLIIQRGIPAARVTHDLTSGGLVCVIRVALDEPAEGEPQVAKRA